MQVNHPRFRVHRALRRHRLGRRDVAAAVPARRSTRSRCSPATARSTSPGDRRFDDGVARLLHAHRSRPPDHPARQQRHARSQLGPRRHRAHLRVRRRPAHRAVRRGRVHRRAARAPRRRDDRAVARRRGVRGRGSGADRRARADALARRRQRRGSTSRWRRRGWCRTERIRITIGGAAGPALVQTIDVRPACARTAGRAGSRSARGDTWIGVTADGDTADAARAHRHLSARQVEARRASRRSRSTGPILVDADGDGRWKRGDADVPLR